MALPTTNLTAHFNASDADNLWVNWQAGTPYHNTTPTDGSAVGVCDDDDGKDLAAMFYAAASESPLWQSSTPLLPLPCLDFDGSDDRYAMFTKSTAGGAKTFAYPFTASAFTVLMSIYIEGATSNSATSYLNDGIFCDVSQYWGIFIRNNGGVYTLYLYNYDGSVDVLSFTVSLNTPYVLMFRHEGGNLYASLNGGSESSVASGNTSVTTGALQIGCRGTVASPVGFYNGRMGEIATYSDGTAGGDLASAVSHFTSRWLASAFIARPPYIVRQAVKQASEY